MKNLQVDSLVPIEIPQGDFGTFNDAPLGWREITQEEFHECLMRSCIEWVDYRQLMRLNNEKIPSVETKLFWLNNATGVAIGDTMQFPSQKKYFAFGCQHNYKKLSPTESRQLGINHYGMFCHVYQCQTCKKTKVEDSSG